MQLETLKTLFETHKEPHLFHRYIHTNSIRPILEKLSSFTEVENVGTSVNGEAIFQLRSVVEARRY